MAKTMNSASEIITFDASSGLLTTTAEGKVAYLDGNMSVDIASTAADKIVGVVSSINRLSSSSEQVGVIVHGMGKATMRSATACTYGDWLVASTNGSVDVYGTNTAQQNIVGYALETPGTGGAVTVYVHPVPFGIYN